MTLIGVYIYQFMSNFQLPGSNIFDSHIKIHNVNQKDDVSLAKVFQHPTKEHSQTWCFDQGKNNKRILEENGHIDNIMFKIILMLHTKI